MKRPQFSFVRRAGTAFAALGFSLSAASAFADEPGDFPAEYGYALTGLGTGGDEVALVFTNTAYTAESPMTWTLPDGAKSIWYLVVGGGASGGSSGNGHGSGGGGAGGVVMNDAFPVSGGSTVQVRVGAGGAKLAVGANSAGNDGTASSLTIGETVITALPGAGGGKGQSAGRGGATKYACGGGAGSSITGTTTQEYAGGVGAVSNGGKTVGKTGAGGGGGGAGGNGAAAADGGTGGIGVGVTIFNDTEYRIAGGGSGPKSDWTANTSTDGGGKGRAFNGSYGGQPTDGSRWGAGGGGAKQGKAAAGAGYQGVVVVRYRVLAGNEAMVPTVAGKPYNGETQTADVTDGEGYYVKENLGGVDAGDYVVTLALSNGWHWTGGSTADTNLTFTITKIDNVWTTEPSLSKTAWKYDEDPATVNPGAAASGAVVVTYDAGAAEMPLTVGGHTAVFTVAESTNYNELKKTIGYAIAKSANAWLTEPAVTPSSWAFDQTPGAVTTGEPKYGEVTVVYDDDAKLTEMPTNLAPHKAVFTVAADETYEGLSKTVNYEVTKRVNGWTTEPVVPKSFNIEDPVPEFTGPTATHGEAYRYFDGDPNITDLPTDLGNHTVTYKVDEGGDYQGYEKTYSFAVTYKPITDWKDASKVYGYRLPWLGGDRNEVALVFTNTAYTFDARMNYRLPQYVTEVSYLVVGGGASGGSSNNANGAGGGGAGGVVTNAGPLAVSGGASFEVVVGAGGARVLDADGKGGTSSALSFAGMDGFLGLKGAGGSKGGAGLGGDNYACGGGAGGTAGATGYDYSGGTGTVSNGGTAPRGSYYIGGGGGGAGGAGAAAGGGEEGSRGGKGVPTTIFDDVLWLAGGGSGSRKGDNSYPSVGGGGKGGDASNEPTAGSTWGAGGGGATVKGAYSGAGHQGVVVVRYVEDTAVVTVPYVVPKAYAGVPQVADVPADYRYTVTANEGGTDVGEYVVTLTLMDGYRWDGGDSEPTNLVFAITQAQNEWTVEPSVSKDYWLTTDEPGVLTNGETRFGTVAATIAKDGGAAQPFAALPTAPGAYVITYAAPETTANYLAPDVMEKAVSFTIFGAAETPDFTVAQDGEIAVGFAGGVVTAAVPYRVSCDVESPKLVNVHALVAEEGSDVTNEVALAENVTLDAAGVGVLDDLKPGAAYAVALFGKGVEDGKSSPTTEVVRVTATGPATGLTAAATFTNDPKEFVVTGAVTPGLGTTTVYLRWSLNSQDLDNVQTYEFQYGETGAFTNKVEYSEISDWLYWDVSVTNVFTSETYGEQAWGEAKAAAVKSRADSAKTTYTWIGGASGVWADAANWSAAEPCYGYPDGSKAIAKFTGDAVVDLEGGKYVLWQDSTATALSVGKGKVVKLENGEVDIGGSSMDCAGATLACAGMRFTVSPGLSIGGGTLDFTGTNWVTGRIDCWKTSGFKLRVRDGETSILAYRGYDDSNTSDLLVSNAVLKVRSDEYQTRNRPSGRPFRFIPGDDCEARMVCSTKMNVNGTYEITVPVKGLKAAPLQAQEYDTFGSTTFTMHVADYKKGNKVPLMHFGLTVDPAFTNKLTLVTDPADVKEKYNAKLEWSAADNTLYYVQDAQFGTIFFVK